jgi:citrate lyase subunit beta/citryl-CoA lyase
MRLRSLLFVPGDRPERMAKALAAGADALILDLEDAVAPEKKPDARRFVAEFLAQPRTMPLFVRINALRGQFIDDDFAAIVPVRPDGIVLPKSEGGAALRDLDRCLTGLGDNEIRILPIATETPQSVFGLGSYGGVTPRLCGLTWGAEDLLAAIGAATARDDNELYTAPYEVVRALALFGAHAAQVPAVETVYPFLKDDAGLAAYARRGRRDGFDGMMAIHPAQVPVINAAFTPTPGELAWAKRVVAAFAADPDAGVLQIEGKMVDAPHLKQARALLAQGEPEKSE